MYAIYITCTLCFWDDTSTADPQQIPTKPFDHVMTTSASSSFSLVSETLYLLCFGYCSLIMWLEMYSIGD